MFNAKVTQSDTINLTLKQMEETASQLWVTLCRFQVIKDSIETGSSIDNLLTRYITHFGTMYNWITVASGSLKDKLDKPKSNYAISQQEYTAIIRTFKAMRNHRYLLKAIASSSDVKNATQLLKPKTVAKQAPAPAAQPKAYVSTLVPEDDDLPPGAEVDPWN